MKPTSLLSALVLTAASTAQAATVPQPLPPTRARSAAPGHKHALLHTLAPAAPPSPGSARILSAQSAEGAGGASSSSSSESTRGGAVLALPPASGAAAGSDRLSSAQATFRVPTARMPTAGPTANNSAGVYAASFWVGVGADNRQCGGGDGGGDGDWWLLRAGVDVFYDGSLGGPQTPWAWYQFAPAQESASGFADFPVAAGDVLRVAVEVVGAGEEVAVTAENFGPVSEPEPEAGSGAMGALSHLGHHHDHDRPTTTTTTTPLWTARQVFATTQEGGRRRKRQQQEEGMCGAVEAAWIVEDFPLAGMPDVPVALADFTSVTFGQAGVTLEDGTTRDVTGAEVLDIRLAAQGGRLTECGVEDGNKVRCKRLMGDDE